MVRALAALERGALDLHAAAGDGVTYAAKIDKAETRIDFAPGAGGAQPHPRPRRRFPAPGSRPGAAAARADQGFSARGLVKASGAPGTVLDERPDHRLRRRRVRSRVQRAGRRPMPAEEFLRGEAACRLERD